MSTFSPIFNSIQNTLFPKILDDNRIIISAVAKIMLLIFIASIIADKYRNWNDVTGVDPGVQGQIEIGIVLPDFAIG